MIRAIADVRRQAAFRRRLASASARLEESGGRPGSRRRDRRIEELSRIFAQEHPQRVDAERRAVRQQHEIDRSEHQGAEARPSPVPPQRDADPDVHRPPDDGDEGEEHKGAVLRYCPCVPQAASPKCASYESALDHRTKLCKDRFSAAGFGQSLDEVDLTWLGDWTKVVAYVVLQGLDHFWRRGMPYP